jgi:hypothetical protein
MHCLPVSNHAHPSVNDMPTLAHTTAQEFRDRFYSFNDGVLRTVEINYAKDGERSVTVLVATRDAKQTANDGWVCVRLSIARVQDFCFADAANTSAAVFSNGVHICWFDGVVGLDFSHFVDPPDNLAELKTSKFFVTGSSVDWTLEPY